MSTSNAQKIGVAVACAVLVVPLGMYASGLFYVVAAREGLSSLGLSTWITLWSAQHEAGAVSDRVAAAGKLGFGSAIVLWCFVAYKLFVEKPSLYGNARFASASELRKKAFFKCAEDSLVVGSYQGKYLFYGGQQFALLAAPTRSGKGVGIVVPNLLSYQGSVVVLDIKQENFDLTSGFRAAHGQEVYLFNPFAEDGRTHRWNPLSYVSSDPMFRASDLISIATMIYPVSLDGRDQFFKSQAQNAFVAFALYLFETRDYEASLGIPESLLDTISIGAMYRLLSTEGMTITEYLTYLSQHSYLSAECKAAFGGLLSQNPEVFGSILGTFKEPLLVWLNPVVNAATSADDFLLTDVRKRKMTIYIGILPNKLAEARLIVNLFISQLVNENTKELPKQNPSLKHQCLLLMDEFTALGRVDIIAKSVSYMAGYNLRLFPIIQSVAQLDAVYGKEESRNLITNHALQIIYTPRIQSDANDYSEMLGYMGLRKDSVTVSRENSRSIGEERRALMLPQELRAMSPAKQILIYEGLESPIFCNKIKYYEDQVFKRRLVSKVKVPSVLSAADTAEFGTSLESQGTQDIQDAQPGDENSVYLSEFQGSEASIDSLETSFEPQDFTDEAGENFVNLTAASDLSYPGEDLDTADIGNIADTVDASDGADSQEILEFPKLPEFPVFAEFETNETSGWLGETKKTEGQ
jgi:type IV secretion system protein VirD4